jgi:hypothetical protein
MLPALFALVIFLSSPFSPSFLLPSLSPSFPSFLSFLLTFFLEVLWFELRALSLLKQVFYHLSHSTTPFLYWIFSR